MSMHGLLLSLNITMRQRYIVIDQMSRLDDGADGKAGTTAPVLPVAVTSAVAWLFPAGFLLIGGGMIAMALKAKRRRARWEAAATRTSGEVTDLRWQSVGQDGDTNLLAFPVLRFSLPDAARSRRSRAGAPTRPRPSPARR